MSIPNYQLQSLAGDNYAKRRVIKKQHKQYETEEQRAQASGKMSDDIKSVFDGIIRNLQLQLTTIKVSEAIVGIEQDQEEAFDEEGQLLQPQGLQYTTQGVIGGFAKLVGLAFELKILFAKLMELKKGVLPSLDYPRISSLMDQVYNAFGVFEDPDDTENGFLGVLRKVVLERQRIGLPVPQIDGLISMYEKKMQECSEMLLRIEGNTYNQNLRGVFLPKDAIKQKNFIPVDKYIEILDELVNRGFLREEDYSVITGRQSALDELFQAVPDEDDNSTIATYETGSYISSSDEESSDDDSSGTSYQAPSSRSSRSNNSVFSSAQNSRQSGHHSHGSRGSNQSVNSQGMGLSGGVRYMIPQHQKLHGQYPLRYY
jgi:hypothetical protein